MFKSKRNRTPADADSIRSTASSSRGDRDVSDLGMMSVPYDRIAPGTKPASGEKPSGRFISSPNTNPTLTADGTALNLYSDQLPARRESNRSQSSTSTHRRETVASSDAGSIHSVNSPVPPESSSTGPVRTLSTASTSRSVRTSASLRGPNNPSTHLPSTSEHSEFGASGSTSGPSTYYRPSTSLELHQPVARSTTPTPSLSARPGTAMSMASSRHGRTNSTGRYPAFNPTDQPASTGSGGNDRTSHYSSLSKGEVSIVPDEFNYPRPDKAQLNALFEDFIREVSAEPPNSSSSSSNPSADPNQQLRALPDDKKWTLLKSMAERKWNEARSRQAHEQTARETGGDLKPLKDSPGRYVQLLMDDSIELKDVVDLGVCLRTRPFEWQQEFMNLHGPRMLAKFLGNLSRSRVPSPNFRSHQKSELEHETLKAIRQIFNDNRNLPYIREQPQIVSHIGLSITSPNLGSRKHALELLMVACKSLPHGHAKIIAAMDDLNRLNEDQSGAVFSFWLRELKETLSKRGRMGSLVGQSDDLKRGNAGEVALADFAYNSLGLIMVLTRSPRDDPKIRMLIRNQLDEAGVQEVYALLRAFNDRSITQLLEDLRLDAKNDLADVADMGDMPQIDNIDDPIEIFRGVLATVDGSRARDFFIGSLRSLLLIRSDDELRLRYHQIINKLISSLIADDTVGMEDFNFANLTGSSVNQLVSQFEDQDRLERVRARAAEMESTAQQLALEKAALEEQLALGGGGQVQKLNEKLASTDGLLKGSRLATKKLQADMDEMRASYEARIAALEAKIMELFAMLKEDRKLDGVIANKDGSVDRQQLVQSLERQEEIRKTIAKLEGAHRKQRRLRTGGLVPGRSGFDDDSDEGSVAASPTVSTPATTPKPPAKSLRRSEVKSGSQFVDAEDEIVREHIEASIVAGINSSHSPSSGSVPRSARQRGDLSRQRGGHPLLKHSGASSPRPSLAPRFVEELKGRRFSRSASAPVSAQDLEDAQSDVTSRRESGSTSKTFSTQATSIGSPKALSKNATQPASLSVSSVKNPGLPILDESRELHPPHDDVSLLPASPSPATSSAHGQQLSTGSDPSSTSDRLLEPGSESSSASASKRDSETKSTTGTSSPSHASPPPSPPPSAVARPINPFAAGLMAQIASKRREGSDSDSDSEAPPSRPASRKPPFLTDIAGGSKKLQSAGGDAAKAGPPRPAFLAGISGGLAGLKAAGARGPKADGGDETKASPVFGAFLRPIPVDPSTVIKAPRKDVAYKASAKVRQLHWDKVAEIKTDTPNIWAVTTAEAPEGEWAEKMKQFDIWSQMETTFSSMEAKKIVDKERQIELMSVLDPKVKKLVEIFMKGYKIDDPQEIRMKILACDEKYCTHNFLENLSKFLPNPEQVGKLNAHKTDTVAELMLLHPADRLMVQLIKIPRLAPRIEGMLYRARFEERISMLEETVEQTLDASLALQDAPKFRQLLSLILMIGNYLNGNSYAGGAFGFKIASINKLVETKSPQGQNLLHFVERTVSSLFHDMEGFMDELDKASEGSRHELQPVAKARTELSEKLAAIDKEIKDHLEDEPISGDRYAQRMIRFLAEARDRIDALNDRRITTESTYNETLKYFNEDPATPSNVFFGIFKTFLTSYKQCQKQNLSWAELEAAKLRRKEAAERQAKEKAARLARQEEQAPAIDNIMESLRAMAPRRRKAGQRTSDHGTVSSAGGMGSNLSQDLGTEADNDTFGSQALSILNTLRSKGFSSAETEPALPRTTRLSASRMLDLNTFRDPSIDGDTSVAQVEELLDDEAVPLGESMGEEEEGETTETDEKPPGDGAPSEDEGVEARKEDVAVEDEEGWQDEEDEDSVDASGDKTFTLDKFSFEEGTPPPPTPSESP